MPGSFYIQVLNLLTAPPGNLAYHLILAFSIAGTLPAAVNTWMKTMSVEGRRMVAGLLGLLMTQAILITGSIVTQSAATSSYWLPVIDRGVTSLSIALMIWLWTFPTPSRSADLATTLLCALLTTLTIFSGLWLVNAPAGEPFNASFSDNLWNGLSLFLVILGGTLILLRRPPGYENGLALFTLLFIGHTLHLLWPLPEGDYAGSVRLTQVAAFPLLLTLPARFTLADADPRRTSPAGKIHAGIDLDVFKHFLALTSWKSTAEMYRAMCAAAAHALNADLCLLMSPPDSNKVISILSGYDLEKRQFLGTATFDGNLVPVIAEALRQARPLHLPADSHIPDLSGLEKILNLPLAGALLAAPLLPDKVSPRTTTPAIILITPYSRRPWSVADQNYLAEIAHTFGEILLRAQETRDLQDRLALAQRSLQSLQYDYERLSQAHKMQTKTPELSPTRTPRQNTQISVGSPTKDKRREHPIQIDQVEVSGADGSVTPSPESGPGIEMVDLNSLFDEILLEAESQLRGRNLRLEVDIQEHLPEIPVNGAMLQSLIHCFLSNAIAASPDDSHAGIRVKRKEEPGERAYIHIQISDSGTRIAPLDLESLSDEPSSAPNTSNIGSIDFSEALMTGKNFADTHQGKLWLDAEAEQGITVNLLLPLPEASVSGSGKGG